MSRRRILIVDDDPSVRRLLRLTLPGKWFEVGEAEDGEQALELLDGSPPDLVLLDWTMPKRSGADVLEAAKAAHQGVPVIVLTAELDPASRAQAESLGADGFLTKPFSPVELLSSIERLLGEAPTGESV